MAVTGVCRSKTADTRAEYATVDYGTGARLDSIPRELYEQRGYQPPFDELPICDEGIK